MKRQGLMIGAALAIGMVSLGATSGAPRQMENLGRGVVAVNQGEGKVFVSWRLLGTEPERIAFNVYRATGNAQPIKLNREPVTKSTCYQNSGVDLTKDNAYEVRAILDGRDARTGELLWELRSLGDAGRCLAANMVVVQGEDQPVDGEVGHDSAGRAGRWSKPDHELVEAIRLVVFAQQVFPLDTRLSG